MTEAQLHEYTKIDPWFLAQLGELHQAETWLRSQSLDALSAADLVQVKRLGFYSYGEISPHRISGVSQLHNQTMTITTISEAA